VRPEELLALRGQDIDTERELILVHQRVAPTGGRPDKSGVLKPGLKERRRLVREEPDVRGRWALFSESPSEHPPDPAVADPRKALDLSQEVRAVLEQIPEKYRSVIVLRDLEGFSTSEIAAILNRKEATIRWRLAEARNLFQKLWMKRQGQTHIPNTKETDKNELQANQVSNRPAGR
jgi:RNA polymerase sigma factor (sigma-70 family)